MQHCVSSEIISPLFSSLLTFFYILKILLLCPSPLSFIMLFFLTLSLLLLCSFCCLLNHFFAPIFDKILICHQFKAIVRYKNFTPIIITTTTTTKLITTVVIIIPEDIVLSHELRIALIFTNHLLFF